MWIVSVVGYTIARFLVAWGAFGDRGVNVVVFGLIDIGTAFPYAKATAVLTRRIADFEWSRLPGPLGLGVASFFAPYLYLWISAGELPAGLATGLIIFVLIVAGVAVLGVSRGVQQLRADRVIDLRDPLDTSPELTPRPFGFTPNAEDVVLLGTYQDLGVLRSRLLQADRYRQLGFVDDSFDVDEHGALVDRWSPQAVHFALSRHGTPIAHARLLPPHPEPLPIAHLFDVEDRLRGDEWELSAWATCPNSSIDAAAALLRHVISWAHSNRISRLAVVMDPRHLRAVERIYQASVERLGEVRTVYNSPNVPAIIDIDESFRIMSADRLDYFSSSTQVRDQMVLATAPRR